MLSVVALLAVTTTASAACLFPVPIAVPNGAGATEDEMVAAQGAVKQYMTDAEAYLACIDEEAAAIKPGLTEEQSAEQLRIRNMRHNAAVDEMEKLAAEFNLQVRAYKKANPG